MSPSLRAALAYAGAVFGTGFALAMVRIPFLVPRFGVRTAELLEVPVMLAIIVGVARWAVRRFEVPATPQARLAMGIVALVLMLGAEASLAVVVSGQSLADYVAGRDPVSGTAYLLSLAFMAVLPALLPGDGADG